jgi:hypothetical protein
MLRFRKHEVPEEQLHQERYVAEYGDVDGGESVHEPANVYGDDALACPDRPGSEIKGRPDEGDDH